MAKYVDFSKVYEETVNSLCDNYPEFEEHYNEVLDLVSSYMYCEDELEKELNEKLDDLLKE